MRALRVAVAYHQQQIALIEHNQPANYSLGDLFQAALPHERDELAQLFGTRRNSPRALVAALGKLGGGRAATPVAPGQEPARRRRGYDAMARRVAGLMGVPPGDTLEAEAQTIASAFGRLVDNLTPATMAQLAATQQTLLQTFAPQTNRRMTAGIFASIARASGFNLYLMASSVTATIGRALGVSVGGEGNPGADPKRRDVGLARLGWTVLALWQIGKPPLAPNQLEAPAVLLVATLRQRLIHESRTRMRQHRLSMERDFQALRKLVELGA